MTKAAKEADELMRAVFDARNELAAAENAKKESERKLMEWMHEHFVSSIQNPDLHITATVAKRRSAKVVDETHFAEALNEIGLVIPTVHVPAVEAHDVTDLTEVLAIADRYGCDFPGVQVSETEYLTVRGTKA